LYICIEQFNTLKIMRTVSIKVYTLDELEPKARQAAIAEQGEFMASLGTQLEDENGDIEYDYSEPPEQYIVAVIHLNNYEYTASGKIFHEN
jgi:uncharacterized FlaG/YvyC family protein